jgi:hypothetical protein
MKSPGCWARDPERSRRPSEGVLPPSEKKFAVSRNRFGSSAAHLGVRTLVLTERQIDDLFGGGQREPRTAELASFLIRARQALLVGPDEQVEQRHIREIARQSDELRRSGFVAPAPGSSVGVSTRRLPGRAPVLARVATAAIIVAVALGGLAAAGLLPRPIQSAVARVARTFGVTLEDPGSSDAPSDRRGNKGDSGGGDQNQELPEQPGVREPEPTEQEEGDHQDPYSRGSHERKDAPAGSGRSDGTDPQQDKGPEGTEGGGPPDDDWSEDDDESDEGDDDSDEDGDESDEGGDGSGDEDGSGNDDGSDEDDDSHEGDGSDEGNGKPNKPKPPKNPGNNEPKPPKNPGNNEPKPPKDSGNNEPKPPKDSGNNEPKPPKDSGRDNFPGGLPKTG